MNCACCEVYAIYFPEWERTNLDLREAEGTFQVKWFNPRSGEGPLRSEELKSRDPGRRGECVDTVEGGDWVDLGVPPYDFQEDWLAIVARP